MHAQMSGNMIAGPLFVTIITWLQCSTKVCNSYSEQRGNSKKKKLFYWHNARI